MIRVAAASQFASLVLVSDSTLRVQLAVLLEADLAALPAWACFLQLLGCARFLVWIQLSLHLLLLDSSLLLSWRQPLSWQVFQVGPLLFEPAYRLSP